MKRSQKKMDVDSTRSNRRGLAGVSERFLRTFRDLSQFILLIPLYAIGCVWISLAVVPGLAVFRAVFVATHTWPIFGRLWALGFCACFGYLLYGLSLIIVLPVMNK